MVSLLMSVAALTLTPAFAMDEENGAPKTLPAASFKLNLSDQQVMDLLSSGDDNPQKRNHLRYEYGLSSCIGTVVRDILMDFSGEKKPLSSKPNSSVAKPSVAVDLAI